MWADKQMIRINALNVWAHPANIIAFREVVEYAHDVPRQRLIVSGPIGAAHLNLWASPLICVGITDPAALEPLADDLRLHLHKPLNRDVLKRRMLVEEGAALPDIYEIVVASQIHSPSASLSNLLPRIQYHECKRKSTFFCP